MIQDPGVGSPCTQVPLCRPGRRMGGRGGGGATVGLPRMQCLGLRVKLWGWRALTQRALLALRWHSHQLSLPSDSNAGPGSSVHSSRSASCWVRCRQSVSLVVLDLGLALFSNSAESQRHPRRSGKLCLILWLIT